MKDAFPFGIGDKVECRGAIGRIVRDKGIMTPAHSSAPLAAQRPPEQVWEVEIDLDRGRTDTRGCWASDLKLVESAPRIITL